MPNMRHKNIKLYIPIQKIFIPTLPIINTNKLIKLIPLPPLYLQLTLNRSILLHLINNNSNTSLSTSSKVRGMKVQSFKKCGMVRVNSSTKMEECMKVNFRLLKETGSLTRWMALENCITNQEESHMKATGVKINFRVLVILLFNEGKLYN